MCADADDLFLSEAVECSLGEDEVAIGRPLNLDRVACEVGDLFLCEVEDDATGARESSLQVLTFIGVDQGFETHECKSCRDRHHHVRVIDRGACCVGGREDDWL